MRSHLIEKERSPDFIRVMMNKEDSRRIPEKSAILHHRTQSIGFSAGTSLGLVLAPN